MHGRTGPRTEKRANSQGNSPHACTGSGFPLVCSNETRSVDTARLSGLSGQGLSVFLTAEYSLANSHQLLNLSFGDADQYKS